MKAAYYNRYGGPEVIEYGDLPEPVLTKDKVKIQVKAVSLNPVDYKIRQGVLKLITGRRFPKLSGADFAGIMAEAGNEVKGFKAGDKIYGNVSIFTGKNGALSEYLIVSPDRIRMIPEGMRYEQAASLPVAALTAQTGIRKSGDLYHKRLLVNGATGGVGHFMIQLGKANGAMVTAVCGTNNVDLAKHLGADEVIDYSKQDIGKMNMTFDVIFDAYGMMKPGTIFRLLNPKGRYFSTLFFPPKSFYLPLVGLLTGKKMMSANMRGKPEDYEILEALFKEGKLEPLIEHSFPLEKTREAFELLENGKPRGKVVVSIS
jgi:NADPH:quinone reductase-like Zn-dependent oxidoreductase